MVGDAITDHLIIFRFVNLFHLVLISIDIGSSLKLITVWLKKFQDVTTMPNLQFIEMRSTFSRKCKSYFWLLISYEFRFIITPCRKL